MAKVVVNQNPELIEAIRGMGIDPNLVNKMVMEFVPGEPVKVHVQGFADRTVINVIKAADGQIEVVREPLEVEVAP